MKKFEYITHTIPGSDPVSTLSRDLNVLGADGWEAIDFHRGQTVLVITLRRKTTTKKLKTRDPQVGHNHLNKFNCTRHCPMFDETSQAHMDLSYNSILNRANQDSSYRDGLIHAAGVAKAQGSTFGLPECPASMVAVYLDRLANGEMP